jgi:hypothetical protein
MRISLGGPTSSWEHRDMPRGILTVLALYVLLASSLWVYREWQLRKWRLRHAALFNATRDTPRFVRWFQEIVEAFPDLIHHPEVEECHFTASDRQIRAEEAVAMAATRFGYPLGEINVVVGIHPERPQAAGSAEVPAPSWSWRMDGEQLYIEVDEKPEAKPRHIHIAESSVDDHDVLAIVAGHEVAHLALAARRLRRAGREDEEITELATILAGYGPVMWRRRYQEERLQRDKHRLAWRIKQFGLLSQPAIAYIRELRAKAAGGSMPRHPDSAA